MDSKAPLVWLEALYRKQKELEGRLQELREKVIADTETPVPQTRKEGAFRYLELPVKLDNSLQQVSGAVSTTQLTNMIVDGRNVDEKTWKAINRNISRLLNSRVKMGNVRKLGRVQGGNRSILWERIDP